ncbi:hypothetical protein [Pseudomonas sp. ESBL1]|uniref:hypothetical protein n=1 Tax=Pseudomonas sp. ESBL1 TaxID=3077324 RepID=UPI002FCC50E4
MPTENRSSNTEMVSELLPPCADDVFKNGVSACLVGDVPKHAAETICRSLSAITGWKIDWHYIGGRTHIKALAPAEQHQGEPVAYLCKAEGAKWLQYGSKVGDPWKPGEVQVTPLYIHADPGEVERLRAELEQRNREKSARQALSISLIDEARNLRAQLAERGSLLRDIDEFMDSEPQIPSLGLDLEKRLSAALSASAEPSAPKCTHRFMSLADSPRRCADCDVVEPSAPVERETSAPLPAIPVNLEEQVQMLNRSNTLLRWALKLIAEGWKFKKFKAPYVSDSKSSINFGLPDSEGENISVYSDSQELPGALKEELSVTTFENCRVTRPINGFNMGAPVERVDPVREALRAFVGAAYPVANQINERGHNWSEAYLDEALALARAALERKPA